MLSLESDNFGHVDHIGQVSWELFAAVIGDQNFAKMFLFWMENFVYV